MSKPTNLASMRIPAGKRNYFIDVQQVDDSRFLKICESTPAGDGKYNRNQVIIGEEHVPELLQAIQSMQAHFGKATAQ